MAFTSFETAIKTYLDSVAEKDELFAKSYKKANKSVKECCAYIMGEAQKAAQGKGKIACKDEEIYNLAMHYFDEDDIKVEAAPKVQAVHVPDSNLIITPKEKTKTKKTKTVKKASAPLHDMEDDWELEIPMF